MNLEYNPVIFMILIVVGVIFISLAILFGLQIVYSEDVYVEDYKDCVNKEIPPHICDMLYPSMPIQSVNYTLIPFP